jgi:hypothetical protein
MLAPRKAKLRAEAMRRIVWARQSLDGLQWRRDALHYALYDKPGRALQRLAQAEAHLARAKRALRAWKRSR